MSTETLDWIVLSSLTVLSLSLFAAVILIHGTNIRKEINLSIIIVSLVVMLTSFGAAFKKRFPAKLERASQFFPGKKDRRVSFKDNISIFVRCLSVL